ncbi:MAG: hypothetical protein LBP99_02745 [Azoarcus sp.]|jgi:hypothetical protein|nr:hypothetical protein [Azoarcus sp.]
MPDNPVEIDPQMKTVRSGIQQKKVPGKNGYSYKEQYGVVVICKDAAHQEHIYDRLRRLGLQLKVVSV